MVVEVWKGYLVVRGVVFGGEFWERWRDGGLGGRKRERGHY